MTAGLFFEAISTCTLFLSVSGISKMKIDTKKITIKKLLTRISCLVKREFLGS